jgi:hypothetical protein
VGIEWGLFVRPAKAVALVIPAALLPCAAFAATSTGTAEVAIVTPLTLVKIDDLSFGSVIASAAAGTVTVDEYTEARTVTGGVTAYGGTVTAAKFSGLTVSTSHLKIDVPNGSITITRVGGTQTMQVNNFQLNGNKNDWVPLTTLFTFQVGARLNVGANQAAGTYVGTFDVTVDYR